MSSLSSSGKERMPRKAQAASTLHPDSEAKSIDFDQVVEVRVGEELKAFVIHRNLLVEKSGYFDSALNGGWQESVPVPLKGPLLNTTCQKVEMEEDDAFTFDIFAKWIYHAKIEFEHDPEEDWVAPLGEAWLLGNKLQAPVFQDAVMDLLLSNTDKCKPAPDIIESIYDRTMPKMPLRKFLVDLFAWKAATNAQIKPENPTPMEEFLADLARLAITSWDNGRARSAASPWIRNHCDYYERTAARKECCK